MATNSLLFPNNFNLHCETITLGGTNQFGNLIAPIITSSNVLCPNVYVERAQYVDGVFGNAVAGTTGTFSGLLQGLQLEATTTNAAPLIIHSTIQVANLDAEFSGTSDRTNALATTGADVIVALATPPIAGQVLIATSATTAEWGNASVSTANLTVGNLTVTDSITFGAVNFTAPLSNVEVNNLTIHGTLVTDSSALVANLYAAKSDVTNKLATTGAPVVVSTAAPPGGAGYVLTSTSATAADWELLSGTGIGSLNGLTANVQTFATGTSGISLNISSVGSTHTFNLPLAGATVTGGVISNTSQTIAGEKTFSDGIVIPPGSTLDGTANAANALNSLTTTVNVSNSAAPIAGYVLQATSGTAAVWQALSIVDANITANILTGNTLVVNDNGTVGGTLAVTGNLSGGNISTVGISTADHFVATCTFPQAPFECTSIAQCDNLRSQWSTTAYKIKSATTEVDCSAATAPTSGLVLTASSSTAATWAAIGNATSANGIKSATTTVATNGSAAPSNTYLLQATSSTNANWVAPSTVSVGGFTGTTAAGLNTMGYTSTAKSAGTTTLTSSSTFFQRFTGASNHTLVMPTPGAAGLMFGVINSGNGDLTINAADASNITTITTNGNYFIWFLAIGTGSSSSSWFGIVDHQIIIP